MLYDTYARAVEFVDGPFEGLCSLAEFAEIHKVDESAIRHAIKAGRFRIGYDCVKFGKQWVFSKEGFHTFHGDYASFSRTRTDCFKTIRAESERAANAGHTIP